jgi:hypothetical protein
MTKRFKLPLALALLLSAMSVIANAQAPNYVRPRNPNTETPLPKVVFIGDTYTAGWPFPAGSNWINEGVTGIMQGGLTSGGALAEFQSVVVSRHPAIVHIMVGANDAMIADNALYGGTTPVYMANITAMVKEAKAANIKVILGNIASTSVPAYSNLAAEVMNAALDGYGAANGIQVINYSDALCGCQGSVGGTGIGTGYVTGGFDGSLQGTPLVAPPSNPSLEVGEVPTAAGYALMTQMAQRAIANLTATLKSGYLQDMTLVTPDNPYPYANQNSVGTGQILQFTLVGQYSDGSTHPQLNSSFAGSSGTWASSNPQAMYVSQTGQAIALTPGTAIIKYTSPGGVQFSEWVMYISAGAY